MVTIQGTIFALAKNAEFNLYGYIMMQTEHPKLFILEIARANIQDKIKNLLNNLDIFAYVNSKFVYVEKHIKTQLTKLYTNIMEQKCTLEKQILQNTL